MLTIIHGDDITASRKYYLLLKEKSPEAETLEGQTVNLTDLAQILEGGGLFNEDKTLFLENFIVKKKNSSEYKSIVSYLSTQSSQSHIIIWEGKELEKSSLTPFKQAAIKPFKLPQSLFAFLDSIKPNSGPQMLKLFHQTLSTMEVEAVFSMLIRQFRILLALHPSSISVNQRTDQRESANIEEIKRLQEWQRPKLQNQANSFTQEQLINIHCQLFVMEKGQKTGTLDTDLITAIDILLMDI